MESNIKVGDRVMAKVGKNKIEVVVMEVCGDRFKVESVSTGKRFVTKSVEPIRVTAPTVAMEPTASAQKPKRGGGKSSLLEAAVKVLENADEPMGVKEMFEEAKRRRLWTPGAGKTPLQTLYSSIFREIKEKGREARFQKEGRGRFSLKR